MQNIHYQIQKTSSKLQTKRDEYRIMEYYTRGADIDVTLRNSTD